MMNQAMMPTTTIEMSTINHTDPPPPEFTSITINYLQGFQLLPHYTLRSDLDRDFYKVMMHGDNKLKLELKRVIIRTFCFRLLLLLPILLGIVFGVLYVYRDSNYFFAYSLTIFLFFSFIIVTQLYFLIHYLRSVRDKESYLKLNSSLAARLEASERSRYQREIERVTYTLPPPNYIEAANSPPAYQQAH
ncbi:hypothetical protein K502DRAFT_364897 [Neoconidiobolus thromboides FSU 785]|nr:hypothetical protein K502DRAFT_364897 [Neoconidiobolus thromboides FSU 785]